MPEPERMKSFRIYTQEPTSVPDQNAAEMSPEAQQSCREEFAQAARGYRRHGKIMGFCLLLAFIVFIAAFLLRIRSVGWFVAVPIVAVLIIAMLRPMLACPACGNNLEILAHFCPECGAPSLKPATRLTGEECTACGREMRTSSRGQRQYTIRACSHCGLWLDDLGV